MKKIAWFQIVNVLLVVVTIVINILANALPLNGLNTGEISDRFDVLFVPAGYVFSIWGLIYIGLIAFAIFQALPAQRDNSRIEAITPAFIAASLGNIVWLFLWHYEKFTLTIFAMLVLLVSLIAIYQTLRQGKKPSKAEWWCLFLPFSIYLGWVSVATIANATQWLYFLNWNGFGISDAIWAVILLIIGTLLAAVMRLKKNDVAYGLVLVWAFVGVGVAQAATALVANAAYLFAVIILLILLLPYLFVKKA